MTKKKKILTTVGLGVGIAAVTTSTVVSCGWQYALLILFILNYL